MTQRIGTGANAQITTYAVTTSTTPRLIESGISAGSKTPGGLTVQATSPTTSLVLNTGPVNPGRFYVQGATLINTDTSIIVYVTDSASGTATTAIPIQPGAALRLDVNSLSQTYLFSASGTPVVKVIGV
jgi:hypothetical protein